MATEEKLDGIIERLDFLGPKVIEMDQNVKSLMEVAVPEVKEIQQIKFARTLTIAGTEGSGATIYEDCPFNGYIKAVAIHWPEGCNALVDVAVGHGNTQFCPRGTGEYLALNDTTPTYPFNEEVMQGEEIWVEMRNRDAANPHSLTVTISVEEK